MTAFKDLQPWQDFMKGKDEERYQDSMLTMRKTFTVHLEKLHRRTLAKYSKLTTLDEEDQAWELWRQRLAEQPKRERIGGG